MQLISHLFKWYNANAISQSQVTAILKLEIWILKAKPLELIAPQVRYYILGRLVRGCLSHRELLELRVKILCFARISLECRIMFLVFWII